MKPGDLVRDNYNHRPRSRWGVILEVVFDYVKGSQNGEIAVYLGENVVHRQDGVVVVNHKCYANGVGTVILDKALLKHIRVYDEDR